MSLQVYNLLSPWVDLKTGRLASPWNMFIQTLIQAPPSVQDITISSGEIFTPNVDGNLIVTSGTISNISLMRGSVTINLTGQRIIPLAVNDSVAITYSVAPTLQFLGA